MKSPIFNEQGNLTEYGKLIFGTQLKKVIKEILDEAENANDALTLGSLLHNKIGDLISEKVSLFQHRENSPLWQMSDEEFESYLEDKYKDLKNSLGMFSMNQEEIERYDPIAKRKAKEASDALRLYFDQQPPITYGVRMK